MLSICLMMFQNYGCEQNGMLLIFLVWVGVNGVLIMLMLLLWLVLQFIEFCIRWVKCVSLLVFQGWWLILLVFVLIFIWLFSIIVIDSWCKCFCCCLVQLIEWFSLQLWVVWLCLLVGYGVSFGLLVFGLMMVWLLVFFSGWFGVMQLVGVLVVVCCGVLVGFGGWFDSVFGMFCGLDEFCCFLLLCCLLCRVGWFGLYIFEVDLIVLKLMLVDILVLQ